MQFALRERYRVTIPLNAVTAAFRRISDGIENVIGERFVIVAVAVRDVLASLASLYPRLASLQRENQANGGFRVLGAETKAEKDRGRERKEEKAGNSGFP